MQQGLCNALSKTNGYGDAVHLISQVPTDTYLSGMLTIMTRLDGGHLIPAGPVEIFAGGGIEMADIEKMCALTIREAHIAALFETLPDVAPESLNTSDWKVQLAAECFRLLKEKVIIK